LPIDAPALTPNPQSSGGLAALAQAFRGRLEVEIRATENGVALMLTEPAALVKHEAPDFVAGLTRETRATVTTILHAIEMAQESSAAGERMPWVETVGGLARDLLRKVDSLAELAAKGNETERRRGQSVTFDPMALLRDVMDGMAESAAQRGVSLEAAVHGELPDRVHGDATGLRRVLRLLLSHSLESTASDAWWTLYFEGGEEAHRVRLEVGYLGELPADLAAWLQAPEGREVPAGDTALSLALVRRLVEHEMGGRLAVAVAEGRTRFACQLTWLPAEVAAPEPGPLVKLSGTSVLAVTPDKSLRKVLQLRYAALGIRAMTVESAEEARRLLAEAVPDAFDLVLAQYSRGEGLDLARWLAANPRWSRLPRITVSMAGEPGQAATAEEAGYQAYLTPPLPLELMRDAFTALLARAQAGTSGELITRFSLAEAAQALSKGSPVVGNGAKESQE
jgi:CheY-like chemotaxis protein